MISVAIVTAKRSMLNGWRSAVESLPNTQCVGVFPSVSILMQVTQGFSPKIVLLGVDGTTNDSSKIQTILSSFPDTLILVLAARLKEEYLFAALRAGANGYIEQKVFPSHLQKAITELHQGGMPLSKAASQYILASFRPNRSSDNLSEREQEVYSLLCDGKNYREIAEVLFVSTHTVRFHIKNIYKKLGVKSRHEAMRLAYDIGIR